MRPLERMFIDLAYDKNSSQLAEKLTFCNDEYTLTRKDIVEFKRMGILKLVDETTLPDEIPCQVIMHVESATHAKYIFFNPEMELPAACHEEPFLNRSIIEWNNVHGGFWLEVIMPFSKSNMTISISSD